MNIGTINSTPAFKGCPECDANELPVVYKEIEPDSVEISTKKEINKKAFSATAKATIISSIAAFKGKDKIIGVTDKIVDSIATVGKDLLARWKGKIAQGGEEVAEGLIKYGKGKAVLGGVGVAVVSLLPILSTFIDIDNDGKSDIGELINKILAN